MVNQRSCQPAAITVFVALVMFSGRAAADTGLDPAFGNGGKIFVDFGAQDVPRALLLEPDGKILMAGFANFGGSGDDIAMSQHLWSIKKGTSVEFDSRTLLTGHGGTHAQDPRCVLALFNVNV